MGAILCVFACVVPFQLLLTACGLRRAIPPHFLGVVGWLCGLRIRCIGRPAHGKLLLLANHVSWLDILALAGVSRSAFVAHGGLAGHRLLKWLCDQNDTLFIARERRGTIAGQVAQLRAALARRRMTVFPEGTTGDGRGLLPFKSALLSSVERAGDDLDDLTVQPVALVYEDAEGIAWLGDEPGADNVRRILCRTRPVRLTIRFLDPLAHEALHSRKAMAEAARAAIAAALPPAPPRPL
ncbi:1-acyl-sn-glycerol-3-phosphate acyltransferase [Altererythrobacter sp. B11]|uniref:lysophospholipid acyltransferase family protein n=1 Tax=Altererythrobacter sp. B11 TaxID=2060312 RepID=UPI000DC722D7|nr:lysophospholipid acyltransferase family protein [Altererythrobacter sp. B11]BBC72333.1 1-acyl-sn-glycerol-3-phosphate acyltransferase [Altererythrobacter sp. B11]